MIIKAHILVNLLNGSTIKYVNKIVQDGMGKNGEYYSYTNELGNQLIDQDGAGKALGDYNSLITQIGDTGLVAWPEGGTFLERKNVEQNMASKSKIRTTIPKKMIASVVLVEQEINEFQQLDIDRRP